MSLDPKSEYYDVGGIETINIIKAKLTEEQYIGYLLGCIIKYGCRLNWKGKAIRDTEKIGTYQKELHRALQAYKEKDATAVRMEVHLQPPVPKHETFKRGIGSSSTTDK